MRVRRREPPDLYFAISENWARARHVEVLRDRLTATYWLVWAAALALLGLSERETAGTGPDAPFLVIVSLGLLGISFLVLGATLKWTAEYANHMAAIDTAARALHINKVAPTAAAHDSPGLRDRLWSAGQW